MTFPDIHRSTVLVLNRFWQAIDTVTPVEAFGHLASGTARALRIEGDSMQPFDWADWRGLPVAEGHAGIGTPRGPVLIPTVIVLSRFDRVPMHRPKFGFRALWERDGGRCQYTGRKLTPAEANIDHVLPRSRGGTDDWGNCVLSDKAINSRKGARTPSEAGLRLLSQPRIPRAVPVTQRIRNLWNIPDWDHFLPLAE
ncbi:HNH endonuclease [Luteolibacter flavescens]|uniref:HNH endonuclease n=1 Tax=Luteolibacter flavescens TaxID=1859460 RepID=A0ABT3FIC2_9BACT|nr:HNH endonuclease [Luteolibacter flavescens]MCW1883316.1 HNH endonuclease [Luteolibacter flavescens]